ncbi:hypothetical protein [Glacieibacterium sp.]|uniref:hypothetical protein n=1 Tax=Glacieibacterium sp. TaxID=2860237 RepID=UPI003B007DC6
MIDLTAEQILREIGEAVGHETDRLASEIFLYVEIQPAVISPSMFMDYGEKVIHHSASERLTFLLYDLWLADPEAKRWAAMKYIVNDGHFEALFTYPNEIDPEEDQDDRRDRIVSERYHNKQIIF